MKLSTILIILFIVFLILIGYKGLTSSGSKYNPAFGSTDPRVVQLKKEIDITMKSFLSAINSITDTKSARLALPAIERTGEALKEYLPRMKSIPDDDKLQIQHYMMDFVKYLKKPLERLRNTPQAVQIISPAIDQIDRTLMYYKPI